MPRKQEVYIEKDTSGKITKIKTLGKDALEVVFYYDFNGLVDRVGFTGGVRGQKLDPLTLYRAGLEAAHKREPVQETVDESGRIVAHNFGNVNVWETLAVLNVDWREEQNAQHLRKYLRVYIRVQNTDLGATHTATARIVEDGNVIEDKSLVVPAGGAVTIAMFTRQPPLYFANINIQIDAQVTDQRLIVLADTGNSKWETIRRLGTEELSRQEYSPNLCGMATWNTPTMIPRWTPEEFEMAWNWTSGNVLGRKPTVGPTNPPAWYQRMVTIPPHSTVTLMSNILYGHLDGMPIIWGIQPQAGADRSIGFDRANFTSAGCFWMDGATFVCYSRCEADNVDETTDITALFPADGDTAWHIYGIYWYPDRLTFKIDNVVVATHFRAVLGHPAGMQVWMTDDIPGDVLIGSNFEIENMAGHGPLAPITHLYTANNPAANPTLNGYVAGRTKVEIYARGVTVGATVDVEASQDGVNWRDVERLLLAVTQPSGFKTVHKGYFNAYKHVRVTINEMAAGDYVIEINASDT